MALVGLQQHRQEGANPEIDPAPANAKGPFPLLTRVGEQAAAAANAGVVEQQMDLVGRLLSASSSRKRIADPRSRRRRCGW